MRITYFSAQSFQQIQQMKVALSNSSLEKSFQTQSTFRRNTRYLNIPQLFHNEHKDSILRRKPLQVSDHSAEKMIDHTFLDATEIQTERIKFEMGKFSKRISDSTSSPKSDYEKEYIAPNSPKLKSFSIEKMISRDKIYEVNNKPVPDERLFNNYELAAHDLSKTCDFAKVRGKSMDIRLKHIQDLYHETKKPFQYCFYPTTTMSSKVNYKIENKKKQRQFFVRRKSSDFAATVLDPQKVDAGLKIASNFKGSNLKQGDYSPFYVQSGKQLPCQLDMRFMTPLTNQYRDQDDKLARPKIDFAIKKMKEDLLRAKKLQKQKPKNPIFSRDEVCDHKFFRSQKAKATLKV